MRRARPPPIDEDRKQGQGSSANPDREETVMDGSPKRWWQWVLMYPTIVIALAGAIPQYYQWISAVAIGLSPFGDVGDAKQQEKTWERNVNCLRSIDHIKPNSSTSYSIDLVSCPTGDILVTLTPLQNPDQQVSRWIITRALFTQVADAAPARLELAQVTTPAGSPDPVSVLDIKKEGASVVRRIERSDKTCVDETIDAYTGRRMEQKPAPCTKF
jgi:hypothetical protein